MTRQNVFFFFLCFIKLSKSCRQNCQRKLSEKYTNIYIYICVCEELIICFNNIIYILAICIK